MQNQEFPAVQIALVHPAFLGDVHQILGTTAFLSHLYPLILNNLRRSPTGHLEKATVAFLVSICQNLGLPITLNQVYFTFTIFSLPAMRGQFRMSLSSFSCDSDLLHEYVRSKKHCVSR